MVKKVELSALGLVVALALVSTASLGSGDFEWSYGDDRIFYGIEDGRLKFDVYPDIPAHSNPIWVQSRPDLELGTKFTIAYTLQNAEGYGAYPFAAFDEAGNILLQDATDSEVDDHIIRYRSIDGSMKTTYSPGEDRWGAYGYHAYREPTRYIWRVNGNTLKIIIKGLEDRVSATVSDYIGTPVAYIRLGPSAGSQYGYDWGPYLLYYDDVRISSGGSKVFSDHFNGSKLRDRKWVGGMDAYFEPKKFNPLVDETTTLSYWIPGFIFHDATYDITIYDMDRQPVRHLIIGEDAYGGGRRAVTWDGRADDGSLVSPGKYEAKLQVWYLGGIYFSEKAKVTVHG